MDPWIKMRCNLATDPRVVLIAERTRLDRYAVVGRLHAFWAWADGCTENGNSLTVTSAFLDELVGCLGFASAMREAHWLEGQEGCLSIPRFEEHNGQSSKKRSVTADRVKRFRDQKANKKRNATGVTNVTPPLPLPLSSDSEEGDGGNGHRPNLVEWLNEAQIKHPDWPRISAEGAWSHYEANGWRSGKNPVKRWKACIGTCYAFWRQSLPPGAEPSRRASLPVDPEPPHWRETFREHFPDADVLTETRPWSAWPDTKRREVTDALLRLAKEETA